LSSDLYDEDNSSAPSSKIGELRKKKYGLIVLISGHVIMYGKGMRVNGQTSIWRLNENNNEIAAFIENDLRDDIICRIARSIARPFSIKESMPTTRTTSG
jgi:hypothetical protein